jgi:hypothetical protein
LPPLPPQRTDWYLEIGYGVLIGCYLLNFIIGKRSNKNIAVAWYKSVQETLEQNFSRVGMTDGPNSQYSVEKLLKESHNVYKLKATGRVNCIGMQATLNVRLKTDYIVNNWVVKEATRSHYNMAD